MSWRTRDAHRRRSGSRPTATAAGSSPPTTSPTPTSCWRWRVSTWSTCAGATPRPRRAPARCKRLARDLPAASGTLAERVASLHLDDVVLEPWEDVDDPAGGEPEVFHECAVEIHELLSILAPGARAEYRRDAHGRGRPAACRARDRHRGRAAGRDGDDRRSRRPAAPELAAAPRRHRARDQGRRARRLVRSTAGADIGAQGALPAGQRRRRRATAARSTTSASATTAATPTAGTTAATNSCEQDQVFAVVPAVTPDLGAAKFLAQQKVPYFGWALSSTSAATPTASGSPAACSRRRASPATRGAC